MITVKSLYGTSKGRLKNKAITSAFLLLSQFLQTAIFNAKTLKCEIRNSFFLFILLPNETNSRPLSLPFPTSHPYQTHISRYAMFPDFRPPEDQDTGTDSSSYQPFHPNIPCKVFDMVVLRKTRGKMVLCWLITYSRILFRTLLKSHDSFLMKLNRARI